ncbi:hypothetical protein N9112_00370 [bacterium]|nr:hypothetical protein [bacterium]
MIDSVSVVLSLGSKKELKSVIRVGVTMSRDFFEEATRGEIVSEGILRHPGISRRYSPYENEILAIDLIEDMVFLPRD